MLFFAYKALNDSHPVRVFVCVQFYRCFRAFLSCSTPERGSTFFSRPTKTLRTIRQEKEHHVSTPAAAPSSAVPSPNSVHKSSPQASHAAPSPRDGDSAAPCTPAASEPKPKLILVAHYRE